MISLVVAGFLLIGARCNWSETELIGVASDNRPLVSFDLAEIRQRGKLIAITGYNSLSYFIYKGKPMGYDYELLKLFADDLGVDLELVVVHDLDSIFYYLNNGLGDIIAYGLDVTKEGRKKAKFTIPFTEVHQVLVQRKPYNFNEMKSEELEEMLIRDMVDLSNKQVHVRVGSAQFDRMFKVIEETNAEIDIVPVRGEVTADDLVRMVAEKEIDFTVVDENVALLGSTYYPDIDVNTFVSGPQGIAWAVRKNSPELLHAMNEWILKTRKSLEYNMIYKKYFKSKKQITAWARSDYFSASGGRISEYDDIIRRYARRIGWDWRLLVALIYEESGFDPLSCSWAGAEGLMQLMPFTGLRFGVYDLADPEQNIRAGTAYLHWLDHYWSEIDSTERIKFILASYNAGETHVRDAVRLAEKYHADPCTWKGNVEQYMKLKSRPKYYNDEVATGGYCRGEAVVNYVNEVLERYRHYVQKFEAV